MDTNAVFDEFPIIKSDRFILKKIDANHLEDVFEIYSNDKVFEYCGIIPKHNKETVKSMIGHFERDFNKKVPSKMGHIHSC